MFAVLSGRLSPTVETEALESGDLAIAPSQSRTFPAPTSVTCLNYFSLYFPGRIL